MDRTGGVRPGLEMSVHEETRSLLGEALKIASSAAGALLVICVPAVLAGQAPASGTFAPVGPPEQPPVRVDAGGACVVDLVQHYVIEGALSGELSIDYRILVAGPCGSPAGTYEEEWIAYGTFSGTVDEQEVTASLLYTADVGAGGSVEGTMLLGGGLEGKLEIRGELSDRRLSYSGVAEPALDRG